ncbi:MAG: hypothetical protein AAGB04_29845 [Pseudomonadota bacterium]
MEEAGQGIACALTPPELRKRKTEIREELVPHLLSTAFGAGESEFTFAKPEVTRAQLERLIKLERACCSFLNFQLKEADKDLVLTISGPSESEDFVRDLFSPERPDACGCSD